MEDIKIDGQKYETEKERWRRMTLKFKFKRIWVWESIILHDDNLKKMNIPQ